MRAVKILSWGFLTSSPPRPTLYDRSPMASQRATLLSSRSHYVATRAPLPAPAVTVRLRRIAAVACLVALVPAIVSFAAAMLGRSNSSFAIRSVEWLRDNGAAGLVTSVENIYYTLTAPSKGGPALHKLPQVGVGGAAAIPSPTPEYRPPRIAPLARPALRGEGVWVPTRRGAGPNPPLLVSTFRSEPAEYPRLVAGVAWIDSARTKIVLYPGIEQPSVELPARGPEKVPPGQRSGLLATFNSAFKLSDSNGGFASHGHTYVPLRDGQATFVGYANNRYNVISWHGGPSAPPNVAFARQNLPLIVDRGRPNPNLNESAEWGATLGNAVRVWRSGIGIDRHGNLIYAAANDQTVASLAKILIHAGAVRAMELDINSYWVTFNSYRAPGALQPQKLLGEMERPANRYLEPDDRDFFAVFERH
jgi:Phosphodiester glycosidase